MRAFRITLTCLLLLGWVNVAWAAGSPRYHTVASGQRLGSIAKRYSVSVDALCTANGIERAQALKVGQKLLVPSREDKDGSMTRRQYGPPERKEGRDRGATTVLASASEPARPVTHRVYAGQRLETIARRYQVSIEALCETNRIRRFDKLKPGQVLVIPGSLPDGGLSRIDEDEKPRASTKAASKKGYVDLANYTTRYRGNVFDKKGKVAPGAIASISKLFGATGNRPRVDPRLIALLADVSEHFGGRPLRIVSGWRDHSYFEDSRHKHSQAVDFSVPGVPNTVVRDYVRRFRNCGVGYYPNSSFVHLDVRESAAYWVDYAGPGEAPRTKPRPDPKSAVADATPDSDPSGPIEEAGADIDDRSAPTPAPGAALHASLGIASPAQPTTDRADKAGKVGTDATSGASRAAAPSTPSEAPAP